MNYTQIYCTLAELDKDLNLLGSERESIVWEKIKQASQYLQQEIGQFIPVQLVYKTQQRNDSPVLRIPPLLGLDSVTNWGVNLASTDYVFGPDVRMWPNGPYTHIEWAAYSFNLSQLNKWDPLPKGVVLTGRWGLYEKTLDVETDLDGAQDAVQTTLKVDDGSKLCPGMVLLMDAEQELVTATDAPTTAVTTLGADLDAASEFLTLADGTKVKIGELMRAGLEQMKVLDISGNQANVVRGWNRTAKVLHASGASVDVYRTFKVQRQVNGTTAAIHADELPLVRYVVPDDVNGLARELAGKMLKFAQGGFAGKTGDMNTGQVTYNYAIPKADVEQIKSNYYIPNAR